MRKTKTKQDFTTASAKVRDYLVKTKDASYQGVKRATGVNLETIKAIFVGLAKEGTMVQLQSRHWYVLLNEDGTKRERPANALEKPKRKRHVKRAGAAKPEPVSTKKKAAPSPPLNGSTHHFSDEEKQKKLLDLAQVLGESGAIFREIAADLTAIKAVREIQKVLSPQQ